MFVKQQFILDHISEVRGLMERYALPMEPLNAIERDAEEFLVRFPLIGAFSSGKSSLLNALVGRRVFATSITPETAVPAELSHAEQESFIGHLPDGRVIELRADDVSENRLSALHPDGWVDVKLNAPHLAELRHLRLVDMPGWDSGFEGHSQAIDSYARRSLAYGVVVSAEEGNLRESMRNALAELVIHMPDMPIIAIISKCDKKTADDVNAVAERVREEITDVMKRAPLRVIRSSTRTKYVDELMDALRALEQESEPLFSRIVAAAFVLQLRGLMRHLETLSNGDDLDSEQIAARIEGLGIEVRAFDARLVDETQALDAHVRPMLSNIMGRVENSLLSQSDSLASRLLRGGDVGGEIVTAARLAVAEGVRDEFEPEMQRYFERLADAVPASIDVDISLPSMVDISVDSGNTELRTFLLGLSATLMPILMSNPLMRMLAPMLPVLIKLFADGSSKAARQIDANEQREDAKSQIRGEVIPAVIRQIEAQLQPAMHKHVESAKRCIAEGVQVERTLREKALHDLQTQLAKGKEEFAARRGQYLADLEWVHAMQAGLEQPT